MFTGPITIAQAIQVAVAPVFLLTGVAALIAVFTSRLARIIDRSRVLRGADTHYRRHEEFAREMRVLKKRARLVYSAISFSALAGVFVSAVIGVIFFGFLHSVNLTTEIAFLFLMATFLITLALLAFLVEVNVSSQTIKIEIPSVLKKPDTKEG